MKTPLLPYLLLLCVVVVASCNKTEEANCQSEPYWVDITLNGTDYNSLDPCAEWSVSVDSLSQFVDNQSVLTGYHFTRLTNQFAILKGDSTTATLRFEMLFFSPDSLLQTTVSGTDTTRSISPENICTLLDSNYHRLGNSLQDTTAVVTNITYTDNNGKKLESQYLVGNWQTSGFGYQPIEIEGVEEGACLTRFEMNALLSDTSATDTVRIFGRVRLPFK